jgi:hypothetical protein
MSNIRDKIIDASQLHKKLIKDTGAFLKKYTNLERDISLQFNEEYRHNNYNLSGLEDFQRLRSLCKKNFTMAKTVNNLLDKMYDLSTYDIDEEVL